MEKNNQQVNETIDMKAGYLYIGKLSNSGNGFVKTTNQTIESNGWTDGGYHDADDVWQQLAVESVAINGKGRGAKELVFLSGTLYDASNNKPVAVYTGDYFKSADDGAGAPPASPTVTSSPLPWATSTATRPDGNRWSLPSP